MTRLILISVAAVLLFGVHAGNTQASDSDYDRQLFTRCAPLTVAIGFNLTNTELPLAARSAFEGGRVSPPGSSSVESPTATNSFPST